MPYFKKLVGDRIYLSPQGTSDEEIEKFTEWMNDFKVTDFTGRSSALTTLALEKTWFENVTKDSTNKHFNIVTLEDDKLIGTISLEALNYTNRSATLRYFYWR